MVLFDAAALADRKLGALGERYTVGALLGTSPLRHSLRSLSLRLVRSLRWHFSVASVPSGDTL